MKPRKEREAELAKVVSQYQHVVDAFAKDLSVDVRYGVSLIEAAKAIKRKRESWEIRLKYRELTGRSVTADEPSGWSLDDVNSFIENKEYIVYPERVERGKGQGRRIVPVEIDRLGREAAKLRTEGYTWKQIGTKLGLSQPTAKKFAILSNPSNARALRRRRHSSHQSV